MIDFLVFSKNRPMQLHALLTSTKKLATGEYKINVLYKYDETYLPALHQIMTEFSDVFFIKETNFRTHVIDFLSGDGFCSFLVDDNLFKDCVDMNIISQIMQNNPSLLCFSLRLGLHLNKCYPQNAAQRIPDGFTKAGVFIWDWQTATAEHDWNYPLSVDGHIFRKKELSVFSLLLAFENPNQYEGSLHLLSKSFEIGHLCACFTSAKILNVPFNQVQNQCYNRHEGISVERMLELWNSGLRLNVDDVLFINNESAHFVAKIGFSKV